MRIDALILPDQRRKSSRAVPKAYSERGFPSTPDAKGKEDWGG
jgi:hypothetical protein